jgi:hypothetical protein
VLNNTIGIFVKITNVNNISNLFECNHLLGQWCTTSGPRATSGPRRVVKWPAMTYRKGTYRCEQTLWSLENYYFVAKYKRFKSPFYRPITLNILPTFTTQVILINLTCRPIYLIISLLYIVWVVTLVWPSKGFRNRLVALGWKRLCTTVLGSAYRKNWLVLLGPSVICDGRRLCCKETAS